MPDVSLKRLIFLAGSVTLAGLVTFSINTPGLSNFDLARTHFADGTSSSQGIKEIRFGVWSYCITTNSTEANICDLLGFCSAPNVTHTCIPNHYGYQLTVQPDPNNALLTQTVSSSWTKFVAVHAASFASLFISFLIVLWERHSRFWGMVNLMVCLFTIILDVAFYVYVRGIMEALNGPLKTKTLIGPGFAVFFASLLIILVETYVVMCGDPPTRRPWKERLRKPILPLTRVLPRPNRKVPESVSNRSSILKEEEASVPIPPLAHIKPERLSAYMKHGKTECPICWEQKTNISALPCDHIFCTECITKCLTSYRRCPLCNRASTKEDLRTVDSAEQRLQFSIDSRSLAEKVRASRKFQARSQVEEASVRPRREPPF